MQYVFSQLLEDVQDVYWVLTSRASVWMLEVRLRRARQDASVSMDPRKRSFNDVYNMAVPRMDNIMILHELGQMLAFPNGKWHFFASGRHFFLSQIILTIKQFKRKRKPNWKERKFLPIEYYLNSYYDIRTTEYNVAIKKNNMDLYRMVSKRCNWKKSCRRVTRVCFDVRERGE